MPRYFFNIYDGSWSRDIDGTDLPDIYTAQREAVRMSGDILREIGAKFWNGNEWKLEVTDAKKMTLFVLSFSADKNSHNIAYVSIRLC